MIRQDSPERTWSCEVSGLVDDLPPGADLPMRMAVRAAFHAVTGSYETVLSSGWARLARGELDAAWAEVDDALPEGVVIYGMFRLAADSQSLLPMLPEWPLVRVRSVGDVIHFDRPNQWRVEAGNARDRSQDVYGYGVTLAAALRSLAAKLREVPR